MNCLNEINSEGFVVIEDVFSGEEIKKIILEIEKITSSEVENSTFRKSEDLFAIRQFHKEVPESLKFIFNSNLLKIIKSIKGEGSFITKSIYFDKPEKSNWFVSYHQDLTISVNKKIESENFKNWTVKQNQYSVQPPVSILDSAFTVRIHLDKTTKENGALKVLNGTHKNGVIRVENIDSKNFTKSVTKSINKLNLFGRGALALGGIKRFFGKSYGNEITIQNSRGAVLSYQTLKKGIWDYLIFSANKPKLVDK